MYAVLGEHDSDARTVKVLIKRIAANSALSVRTKGYSGAGELLRKGARQLRLFRKLGCTKLVICMDADGPDPTPIFQKVRRQIVQDEDIADCCIVIPVQELEAWLLADVEAAKSIFSSWSPAPVPNPESIPAPKEYLARVSRDSRQRPRYSSATHNERLAAHVDIDRLEQKCPSFRPLRDFVRSS